MQDINRSRNHVVVNVDGVDENGFFSNCFSRGGVTPCLPNGSRISNHNGTVGTSTTTKTSTRDEHGRRPHLLAHHQDVDIERALAKEIGQLSVKEREEVVEDIRGVRKFEKEDPNFVMECIKQMRQHLSKVHILRSGGCSAYKKAKFLAPASVSKSDKLLLMFLRANNFDPKTSSRSLLKHYEFKERLFPGKPGLLARGITIDDLSNDDLRALRSGYAMVLPCKDNTGRPVIVVSSKRANCKIWENQVCWSLRCKGAIVQAVHIRWISIL